MIFENSLPKANFGQNIRDSPNGSLTADSRSLQTATLKIFWSLETRIRLIFPKLKILVVLFDDCCFIVNFMIQSVSCLVIFVTE